MFFNTTGEIVCTLFANPVYGPLLIAAAIVFVALVGTWRVENSRDHNWKQPGWLGTGGILLLVFLDGVAYVTVRQFTARGTVAGLVSGATFQEQEAIVEGTVIREPDVREGRAAYIVRAQTVNGSPASGLGDHFGPTDWNRWSGWVVMNCS